MSYDYMEMWEDIFGILGSAGSASTFMGIAAYVFSSLAIYTIAQRREIKHAWMSWVPVLNMWILGSISDQYRYVTKGQVKNKRKVLLIVKILSVILSWVAVIRMIVSLVLGVSGMAQNVFEMEVLRLVLGSLAWFIPAVILGFVALVVELLALFDLYSSCDPANNVLYLVLSIIPGINTVARPLFLFLCRNKDNGMPPRRKPVTENPCEF